ncbi:hypothetical protein PHYSODRAFT_522882 [Phytophthora sojae]|uniref:Reverse transcriptase domain-containing protein n=1 Tax=Phytophthora sojae (strain P6497) TaxID=1094619 RepID=G5A397_PHYSP|nr:hypothetical protein PHYSODRAFT_522882 [Phytophthora sojae]EGZ10137.1 hypothetical protein PHYSODRAFT_522882 [Phytophthora sojae]|eukprot:XP_009534998.1 hypothetical protein PHYSODRAFT_522882 [Phytophthora sojae]
MMLATRFRQVLSGICTSLAGLSFAPKPAALATTTPPTLLSRSPRRAHQTNRFRIGPNHRHVRHHDDELQLLSEAQRALQLRIYNDCAANTIELRAARNKILHQIRVRCRAIASRKLDERITRIENLSDSARMYAAVGDISPHRPQPLTADAVWAHKWLCARVQRYRETIHVLGIDLSRAFDTIDRVKLVEVLQTFLHDDEVRLIKVLLADTKLSLRSGSKA